MNAPIHLKLCDDGRSFLETEFQGMVVFGRQDANEPEPENQAAQGQPDPQHGCPRYLIARRPETTISRRQFRVESISDLRVRITNLGATSLELSNGMHLASGQSFDADPPLIVTINRTKEVQLNPVAEEGSDGLKSLVRSAFELCETPELARTYASIAQDKIARGTLDNESLLQWIQYTLQVLHSAASTSDFFPQATKALGVCPSLSLLFAVGEVVLEQG